MEVGERGREGWKGGGSGSVTIHVHPIHCHSIGCEGEREREAREGANPNYLNLINIFIEASI